MTLAPRGFCRHGERLRSNACPERPAVWNASSDSLRESARNLGWHASASRRELSTKQDVAQEGERAGQDLRPMKRLSTLGYRWVLRLLGNSSRGQKLIDRAHVWETHTRLVTEEGT